MEDRYHFGVSIETEDESGRVVAVYFQIRKGKSVRVEEFADGAAFADFDKQGRLLGIELLAPCEIALLESIAKNPRAKRFVRESVPAGMVA
jgi:uncharacterized protein YuzE